MITEKQVAQIIIDELGVQLLPEGTYKFTGIDRIVIRLNEKVIEGVGEEMRKESIKQELSIKY